MADVKILEILSPGILTSVQDLGRYGYGRFGVAPSGALDSFALRIANLLVGNRPDQACLEAMLLGPAIRALDDIVVAVTGGNLQPRRNKQPIEMWRSHIFKKNDILSFGSSLSGFRAYVAVGGGISVPPVMGSRSTNLYSGFGGLQGRALEKNDILTSENHSLHVKADTRAFNADWIPVYPNNWSLRVIWGPQDDHFLDESRGSFLDATYKMSSDSDRTGIRLQGPVIRQKPDMQTSIISEGVIAGSVQIPGDGKPIIILGETVTGGYRKIATVISADLPLLGQIKPGDAVRFKAVSLDEARQALIGVEEKVQGFKGSGFKGSEVQGSEVQRFRGSKVQRFKGSGVQRFRGSGFRGSKVQRFRVQRFKGSGVQGFRVLVFGCQGGESLNSHMKLHGTTNDD